MPNGKTVNLKLQPGEYWWGGAINSLYHQPYSTGSAENLVDLRGNSAMPLLLSNKGRYVWSEEPFEFSLTTEQLIVSSLAPDGEFEIGEGLGTLRDVYRTVSQKHFPPSGSIPDPLFFTHPQYNTWIEMTYFSSQERVLEYATDILKHGFPPGVLMIDTLWHPTYGNWVFDAGRYPDPKGMVHQLHEMGFKVMLWMIPYITPDTLTFRELRDKGFLFTRANDEPAIISWWDGYSAALDLTKPDSVAWLNEKLDYLVNELGVDGFKFDGGQPGNYAEAGIPNAHAITLAWNRIGLRYPLSEFKDSWKSAGWPLAQRIRDRNHSWSQADEGLGSLIPMGLTQGLLGYTFNCPDMVGGGEYTNFPAGGGGNFDAELFVRCAQASALFPMMQFSAAPWRLLDAEHLDYCRATAQLHTRLGDEILALAKESADSGEPIMRHMAYEFPDSGYEQITDQFMLGSNLLVAPVLEKGASSRLVEFPPGEWLGDDGSRVNGPRQLVIVAPLSRLPWYRKISRG